VVREKESIANWPEEAHNACVGETSPATLSRKKEYENGQVTRREEESAEETVEDHAAEESGQEGQKAREVSEPDARRVVPAKLAGNAPRCFVGHPSPFPPHHSRRLLSLPLDLFMVA